MVSAGISGGVAPIKNVMPATGTTQRSEDVSFGEFMMQSMADSESNNTESGFTKVDDRMNVNDIPQASKRIEPKASERIEKKEQPKEQAVKDSEKFNEKVKDAVEDIKDKIKEEFDVTDEDIEKALETLGLTMADLLNEANLTDFIVELTGLESSVDLLISSDMLDSFNDLLGFIKQTVEDIAQELGVTVEELTELIEDMELMQKADNGENAETIVDKTQVAKVNADDSKETDINKGVKSEDAKADAGIVKETVLKQTSDTGSQVKSDTSSDSSQMWMNDKHTSDVMPEDVFNNFTNAINEAFEVNGMAETVDAVKVVNQIIENAKIVLNQKVTSMELMLNPENLGKVNLNISVKEGVVTASIVAQNEAVREAIESQIIVLKENLNNQGIKVEAVEVTVGSHAFETGADQNKSEGFDRQQEEQKKSTNRPLRMNSLEELLEEELTEEERIILDMMEDEGNQVNFKA